ncbi:VOC family protein [Amycolatopsis acidicola]|uniref:VOC family protein n=1 Tax=Amycolatopsis acidicola TaxID=2596893 RepID=A0A5N0UTC3_9PSEU|nr:VOC family protein [Amycolatopsis acidicola]KAA9153252.1 VOC family protein [Amycolatopsis acidicola]
MSEDIGYLDHTVLLTRELEAVAKLYTDLGFTLSAPSAHRLSTAVGEPLVQAGTANQCAAFGKSYVEILGLVDENAPDPWHVKEMIKVNRGLLLTAGTGDAEATERRWRAAGFPSTGVRSLERPVETPEGERTLRARGVYLSAETSLGVGFQAGQQLTPEYVHQPHLLRHANGARGLESVLLAVADDAVGEYVDRYSVIFDAQARENGPRYYWQLSAGRFELVAESAFGEILPGEKAPALPFLGAQTFSVENLDVARKLVEDNGIATWDSEGGFFVRAADAFGVSVGFVA